MGQTEPLNAPLARLGTLTSDHLIRSQVLYPQENPSRAVGSMSLDGRPKKRTEPDGPVLFLDSSGWKQAFLIDYHPTAAPSFLNESVPAR